MAYLLDANVFIQAKNLHYGLDFCPAFWEWLIAGNQAKRVFSIEKISDEMAAGDDELSEWAAERGDGFFLKPDPSMLPVLGSVSSWIANQHFEQAAIATFLQVTDYYLVAHALSHGDTIVTHEVPSDSRKKIKIPNVCIGLSIKMYVALRDASPGAGVVHFRVTQIRLSGREKDLRWAKAEASIILAIHKRISFKYKSSHR